MGQLATDDGERLRSRRGVVALVVCFVLLSIVWCVILPTIGTVPVIAADIERVDAAGIDASALYWTDLESDRLWSGVPERDEERSEVVD